MLIILAYQCTLRYSIAVLQVAEDTSQPPSLPCPSSTNSSSSDDDGGSCDNAITITVFIHTHPILTGVTMAMILVAVTALGLCLWACYTGRCGRRRRASGRYKSVSHFFPVGAGGEVHISIPELGVPKAMSSEREKLLVESDEDEL